MPLPGNPRGWKGLVIGLSQDGLRIRRVGQDLPKNIVCAGFSAEGPNGRALGRTNTLERGGSNVFRGVVAGMMTRLWWRSLTEYEEFDKGADQKDDRELADEKTLRKG